jgi:hypothetical protein
MSAFEEWIKRHKSENSYVYGRPDRKDPARLDAESSDSKARAYDKAIIDCVYAIMREGGEK